MDIPLETYSHA